MENNEIGAEGGKAVGEALKTNTALTSLEYVAGAAVSPSQVSCRPIQGRWWWLDAYIPPPARPRRLRSNDIGDEAEAAISEAWKHGGGLEL